MESLTQGSSGPVAIKHRGKLTCRATPATDVNQLAHWLLWGF